jgi:hypothetical protein
VSIAEKLRQAYHNDLTDVPLLLDAADEIERLQAALEQAADIADSFRCGHCGMDGKAGAAIRAALEAKP